MVQSMCLGGTVDRFTPGVKDQKFQGVEGCAELRTSAIFILDIVAVDGLRY